MKLPALIKEELERCTVPHTVERGKRHWKIFINGVLCGIIPMNGRSTSRRAELNVRAQIRKQIKAANKNNQVNG
jgi:hypothetical protein